MHVASRTTDARTANVTSDPRVHFCRQDIGALGEGRERLAGAGRRTARTACTDALLVLLKGFTVWRGAGSRGSSAWQACCCAPPPGRQDMTLVQNGLQQKRGRARATSISATPEIVR